MKLRVAGVVVVFAISGLVFGAGPAGGIVGGRSAANGAYPFMASVQGDGSHFCGGSVIGSRWVLTAAHCVSDGTAEGLSVVVGTNNNANGSGTRITVDEVVVHPAYDDNTHDAALLHLAQATSQATITLSTAADDDLEAPGAPVRVTGWGDITPTLGLLAPAQLKEADLKIVSDSECATTNVGFDAATGVCAAELLTDSCQGDSGGPLFAIVGTSRIQVGIVSYGFSCAIPLFPGVYSEVNNTAIRSWIRITAGV